MKFCPVCDRELADGTTCPDDGAVLVEKRPGPETALVGVVLKGTYRIEAKIGAGGMGTVYRAVQLPLGRDVAVKVLLETVRSGKDTVKRFYREAKVLSGLNHPNVVSLIDFGNTDTGLVYYVMEHLDGVTLEQAMVERAPLSFSEVVAIMRQVCAGVSAAHATGLIHRDLKPANVFLARLSDDSEAIKILDFGIAKRTSDQTRLTRAGDVVGTPGYISPEQLKGEVEPDTRADVYALGAILYFLLRGKRPYDGPSTQSIIVKQLTEPPAPLDFAALGYPAALGDVVLKAMAIDREQRYATASALVAALDEVARSAGVVRVAGEAAHLNLPARRPRPRPRSATPRRALLTALLLAILGAGGWATWRAFRSPAATGGAPAIAAPEGKAVRGVSETSILLGMTAAFSGPNKELGREMRVGIDTRLRAANAAGGVHGRTVQLVALDDGYEPARARANAVALVEQHGVFAFIGNMGTLPAEETLPVALAHRTLFFAGFTGTDLLARTPPDRYVFNFRPRYSEEAVAIADYLVERRGIAADRIAVFAQEDGFGQAGVRALARRLGEHGLGPRHRLLTVGYARNASDVSGAVKQLVAARARIRAVVMFGTYRPTAQFVKGLRDAGVDALLVSASPVGTAALVETFAELGSRYADGVLVAQVVPPFDAALPAAQRFRADLATHFPEAQPSLEAFEGYVATELLLAGLERVGRELDTERLIDALEKTAGLDLGIGVPCTLSAVVHQCSHEVWASRLDASGRLSPTDL